MKLYHFTSKHHVQGCLDKGLRLGVIPIQGPPDKLTFIKEMQWLTQNPEKAQSWNENSTLPYDRTEYRLTVKIPKAHRRKLIPWRLIEDMSPILSSDGDPDNWYVFDGIIKPGWIRDVVQMK